MAAVNEMRLPDFSVCLQAQAGIMPLKGKCIPRVQRVVLICRESVERGIVVLLQWLWEWSGSVQREGQARQVIGVLLQRLAKTTRIGATGGASPLPYEKRIG